MNALQNETSPYLLQHAGNPVDWHPWGERALRRAREEDKPILLSIGYSACHWCHVMERESFESEDIAALMNEHFVNIKVDREERPDLDAIYMGAVQLMTGRGGWPMTVFLTPEQVPFYGGTYFPPEDRLGLPGFPRILMAVSRAYRTRRDEIRRDAAALVEEMRKSQAPAGSPTALTPEILNTAARNLMAHYDERHGGFGGAPKFPPAMALSFLLQCQLRTGDTRQLAAVEQTLEKMAGGGVYDQLGGGFHRYSVDDHWLVPHFEKMLYDNALLSRLYVDAWLVTGKPLYRRVAEETIDYVLREMASPEGGFYSSQDADSEGHEGRYFVWTADEVMSLLGEEDGVRFCRFYDVSPHGNFEGRNILHILRPLEVAARMEGMEPSELEELLARGRRVLFAARENRVKPARDVKVLTAWNGMMLRSLAEAARAFDRDDYRDAAERNARLALAAMGADSRLDRRLNGGPGRIPGYLEDYACLADGMVALYEATFDVRWYRAALSLGTSILGLFRDSAEPGLFFTARDEEELILRAKDFYDNATPSGNSVAADVFVRLWKLTGDHSWRQESIRILEAMAGPMSNYPSAFARLLGVLDFALARPVEIAIAGEPADSRTRALLRQVFSRYLPNKVIACGPEGSVPLLKDRRAVGAQPAAYVCQNFACNVPVTRADDLAALLTREAVP